jgi:HD-GYP domain-containing protein (c-di-GMP phosphodiesterase class II)
VTTRLFKKNEYVKLPPHYRIVLAYLLFGVAWIFFSDIAVENLFSGERNITQIQHYKGWAFVVMTAVFLFVLIRQDFKAIQQANAKILESIEQAVMGWIHVMDVRHKETRDHSERVTRMTVALAKLWGIKDEKQLESIRYGAILHDIGKVGIPDDILTKPGKLSEAEWQVMKLHPQIAYDILSKNDFLRQYLAIPYEHHERWDGQGYPQGLKGHQITFEARLFAIVDVWDAIYHRRVYKDAWPEDEVLAYLSEQSGKAFDPAVSELFVKNYAQLKIAADFS